MRLRRLLSVVSAVVLAAVALPSPAFAAPPDPSAISVSDTELSPGEEFAVTFELYNADTSTIISAKAQLFTTGPSMSDLFDIVSCEGTVSCGPLGGTFRGAVGDLPSGESRTVVFHLRVKDTAPTGTYRFRHQFTGGNFEFAAQDGPDFTISSQTADLAVSLDASPRGILTSRITYTVSVANLGPANATGVRIDGTYAAGLTWSSGSGCVRTTGRSVQCAFSSIPAGGSASATFAVNAGLLALGSFSTSVTRGASSPTDPVSANDSASKSCSAITGLLVFC
jgi:uncharacterized repeat protein (TIGR01451 family)